MAGPMGNPITSIPAVLAAIAGGEPPSTLWYQWFVSVKRVLSPGINTTVTLANLTTGGANGSLKVVNGIITAYTAPT